MKLANDSQDKGIKAQVSHDANMSPSLESLQINERRDVLDTVAKIRTFGLDKIVSSPQLVISGGPQQSMGDNSVLDALTQNPIQTEDDLLKNCALEIVLRCSPVDSITIRLVPDSRRPPAEQDVLRGYQASVNDFSELPGALDSAMGGMGISNTSIPSPKAHAYANDVLRIVIEGPTHPHINLLNVPQLLGNIRRPEPRQDIDDSASMTETDTSTIAPNTPTHTALSTVTDDFPGFHDLHSRDTVPCADQTFMIRDRQQGRMIVLNEGNLRADVNGHGAGGWRWACTEKNGWFGFRNTVSGTYFGHDGKGGFWSKVSHHKNNEWFCTRAHSDGGHLLLMLHTDKWKKMAIGENGSDLVETDGEGTAWDFVKV